MMTSNTPATVPKKRELLKIAGIILDRTWSRSGENLVYEVNDYVVEMRKTKTNLNQTTPNI